MKINSLLYKTFSILVILIAAFSLMPVHSVAAADKALTLETFSSALMNDDPSALVGVYVEDLMALRVVRQPSASYVSPIAGTATLFDLAAKFESIGLLAHNYLAGSYFAELKIGDEIILVFGDGSSQKYKVKEIKQYQALKPTDPYSNFINLDDPDKTISSTELFKETYAESGSLILQTCISQDGVSSWGRLFVIAIPLS